jgi:hypothetical protein
MSPLLLFARRYWRVLAVSAAVAITLVLVSRCTDQAEQRGYDRATSEMAARVLAANAETEALEQRQRIQSQQAAQAWESKRNELQGQVDDLLARPPVVRLCKPAAASPAPVSGAGPATARPDDGAGRPVDSLQAGRDVGTQLVQLGAECERYRQQLSELQAWVMSTSASARIAQ